MFCSTISLASKCTMPAFRMHLRAHNTLIKVFSALQDSPKYPVCHLKCFGFIISSTFQQHYFTVIILVVVIIIIIIIIAYTNIISDKLTFSGFRRLILIIFRLFIWILLFKMLFLLPEVQVCNYNNIWHYLWRKKTSVDIVNLSH